MKKEIQRKRLLHINTPNSIKSLKYNRKLKREVFSHYGKVCECCGCDDIDMLSMDHIEGGGREQMDSNGINGGSCFYKWLKKKGYPPGLRVLCMNCNLGRFINGGVCPHKDLL